MKNLRTQIEECFSLPFLIINLLAEGYPVLPGSLNQSIKVYYEKKIVFLVSKEVAGWGERQQGRLVLK